MARRKKKTTTRKVTRRRRPAAKKASRRRTANKVKLSLAGLKKALPIEGILYTAAGGLLARAAYGYVQENMQSLDSNIAKVVGVAAPVVAAIGLSGKMKVVGPVALGAAGMAIMDVAAKEAATFIAEHSPGAASAVYMGMGGAGYGAGSSQPSTTVGTAGISRISLPPAYYGNQLM